MERLPIRTDAKAGWKKKPEAIARYRCPVPSCPKVIVIEEKSREK
jgi:hypothetical protein